MLDDDDQRKLFDLSSFEVPSPYSVEPEVPRIRQPVWTENKANLIAEYLYLFVLITKHGTYIDGFAGPQYPDLTDCWAAKLVLESEPRRFRHFHLYDSDPKKIDALVSLRDAQREIKGRTIQVNGPGDFNVLIKELLASGSIGEKEATFCLLDQHTFECHWSTVKTLAQHKSTGHKIELFYFFAVRWLDRAFSAVGDEKLESWWGRSDFKQLKEMRSDRRVRLLCERFRSELKYASVKPWPIFERSDGGPVMYYMVHATDHPEAPKLMSRAYRQAVSLQEPIEQSTLEFD